MNDLLRHLIEALREELKQYGEMLALLEHQQDLVIHRQSEVLLETVATVNAQAETIQVARREREQRQRCLARHLKLPEESSFTQLGPRLPADYRPLIQALVQENNELLVRVQQRARQNHLLLSRAVELMQRLMNSLVPGANPSTYGETGQVLAGALPNRFLHDVTG